MNLFELYQHVNNTDVAIMPIKASYFSIKDTMFTKYSIRWYNVVNPRNVFCIKLHPHDVVMTDEQAKSWRLLSV